MLSSKYQQTTEESGTYILGGGRSFSPVEGGREFIVKLRLYLRRMDGLLVIAGLETPEASDVFTKSRKIKESMDRRRKRSDYSGRRERAGRLTKGSHGGLRVKEGW